MEAYKITSVIKKCTLYKTTATVRQEKNLNNFEHESLKSWGQ